MSGAATWDAADEHRHPPGAAPSWQEGWTFDFWSPGGEVGGSTALVLWPAAGRAWYWAALVRAGEPLLYLADLDVDAPRRGLEIRAEGLWAAHTCEAPFEQWTVANEAFAVALDDPAEALGRAHGTQAAVAFDLEWYAAQPAEALVTTAGYRQEGDVHAVIELAGGPLVLETSARRMHWWGDAFPWPVGDGTAVPSGPRAPVRLGPAGSTTLVLDRVLTPNGWWDAIRHQ